jgi:hypothetical protein
MFTELTIKDFSDHVKRSKQLTHPQWFALKHNILLHPDFHDVTGDEFRVFIWVLGISCQLNQQTIKVFPDLCARQLGVPKKTVDLTIEKLNGKRWRVSPVCNARVARVSLVTHELHTTRQDKTRQDKTKETNTPASSLENPNLETVVGLITFEAKIVLDQLKPETLNQWLVLYPDKEFIRRELIKSVGWYQSSSRSPTTQRGWSRALNAWLAKNWESRDKVISFPTSWKSRGHVVTKSADELLAVLEDDNDKE